MTTDGANGAMREAAQELLERTETTLLAIYSGEVRASDEDTWTMVGFRPALQWVLGFGGAEAVGIENTRAIAREE
jgi:hypothetical protein